MAASEDILASGTITTPAMPGITISDEEEEEEAGPPAASIPITMTTTKRHPTTSSILNGAILDSATMEKLPPSELSTLRSRSKGNQLVTNAKDVLLQEESITKGLTQLSFWEFYVKSAKFHMRLQGFPFEKSQKEMAVALKWCILEPMLVKLKGV